MAGDVVREHRRAVLTASELCAAARRHMLLGVSAIALVIVAAGGATAASSGLPPVRCDLGSCGAGEDSPGGGSSVQTRADGEGVSVTVWGTGVRGGGETAASGRRIVQVPPACFYRQFLSGVEYAAAWAPGGDLRQLQRHLPPEDVFEPFPMYKEAAAGPAGHWYFPTCELDRFPGSEEYVAGYRAFRAAHDVVFVLDGDPAPSAQVIPPESLAQLAYEQTDLPQGTVQWNPRLAGSGATLVGTDTWVWLDDPTVQVEVTAEVPGLSATVTSVFASMLVEADGAQDVTCRGGPGAAWTGQEGDGCVIVFERSTANQGVKDGQGLPTATLTATSRWEASWTSSATPGVQTAMADPQRVVATAEVPVAEVQTLVTT